MRLFASHRESFCLAILSGSSSQGMLLSLQGLCGEIGWTGQDWTQEAEEGFVFFKLLPSSLEATQS